MRRKILALYIVMVFIYISVAKGILCDVTIVIHRHLPKGQFVDRSPSLL